MLFHVHFFPMILQSIFKTIYGRRIQHLLRETIPFINNTIAEEKISRIQSWSSLLNAHIVRA